MKGGRSDNTEPKWHRINQIMLRNDIGIMALQETHLKDTATLKLNNTFARQMRIINSIHPESTSSAGVAFVLSKHCTLWNEARTIEVIPGRAILLIVQWRKNGEVLKLLNVYSPNSKQDKIDFWTRLRNVLESGAIPKPNIILGDFNMVEDSADRLPAHLDDHESVNAFKQIKSLLHLKDGWRDANPNELAFTYKQALLNPDSRIDRIYMTDNFLRHSRNWDIFHSGIESTDHQVVHVQVYDPGAPEIGPGHWTIPSFALEDTKLMKEITNITEDLQTNLASLNQHTIEPPDEFPQQSLYQKYKLDVTYKIKQFVKKKSLRFDTLLR
ncbi:Endonuclease/exonuclease/phosphatase [Cyathus striatus]|nr:Endonuclease/exonuclease/phosphatase [Cyathus striatus]